MELPDLLLYSSFQRDQFLELFQQVQDMAVVDRP